MVPVSIGSLFKNAFIKCNVFNHQCFFKTKQKKDVV